MRALLNFTLVTILLLLLFPSIVHGQNFEKAIIQINENGFNPKTAEIKQGETVIFENSGKNPHWPASNIHPTHEIYPEFDSKRPIDPGKSWTFTFNKAGSWKFHDHLFPEFTGQTIVKENPNKDFTYSAKNYFDKIKGSFLKISQKIRILVIKAKLQIFKTQEETLKNLNILEIAQRPELEIWLNIYGPEKIMSKLLADSGGGSTIDCHQQAHQIGRLSYKIFGPQAFKSGDPSCHSGYYHGLIEGFIQLNGTKDLSSNVSNLCNSFDTNFGKFECLHGIGHGLLAYADYDLPETIQLCKSLSDNYSSTSCYGGVFMENIVTAQGNGAIPGHTTRWVSNDPLFPCNSISQEYDLQYQCYQMQTSQMLTINSYDFDKVIEACLNAPKDFILVCFKSLGRDIAGFTLRDPSRIIELCNKVPKYGHDECIVGALNVIVDFWGPNLKDQGTSLCKLLPKQNKEICFRTLAGRLTDLFNDQTKQQEACQMFEYEYQNLCDPRKPNT